MGLEEVVNQASLALDYIRSNRLLLDLVYTAVILFFLYLFIKLVDRIFYGLHRKGIITEKAAERVSRSIGLIAYVMSLIGILYVFTQAEELTLLLIALVIIGVAAGWDVIMNLVGYYAITIYRLVENGVYVEIGGMKGRIKEVNALYTLIESGEDSYRVPNKEFLRRPFKIKGEAAGICIIVRIRHDGDLGRLKTIENSLTKIAESKITEFTAIPDKKRIRIVLEKIAPDYAEYMIPLKLQGPEVDIYRRGQLVRTMAIALTGAGILGEVELKEC